MIERLFPSSRQRALDPREKAARREAILDAAERLYGRAQVLPGVADVAAEAGLAKGTMYLYFETKEAIYLGLHQRNSQRFFEALIARLQRPEPFDVDAMIGIVDEHMITPAGFLPLSHVCMGAGPERIDAPTHEAFHRELGTWLTHAGALIEQRLPRLAPGDGMRFLHHGYALLLGLYQLLGQPSQCVVHARLRALGQSVCGRPPLPERADSMGAEFRIESHAALRGLWQQAQSRGLHPALPVADFAAGQPLVLPPKPRSP